MKLVNKLKKKIIFAAIIAIVLQPVFALSVMPTKTFAADPEPAGHIVLNEIQISGIGVSGGKDEFVELYNPTEKSVDITGWKLAKLKKDGSGPKTLVDSLSGIIQPKSFFLITSKKYTGDAGDMSYSIGIGPNQTVVLYDAADEIIDLVGFGNATEYEGSGAADTPSKGKSASRNPDGKDTNDNKDDFVNGTPTPQKSEPPVITVNNKTTNDQTPTVSGTVNYNTVLPSNIKITIPGAPSSPFTAKNNVDGIWEADITDSLSDGTYDISAVATDANGNDSKEEKGTLIIDTVKPDSVADLTSTLGNGSVTLEWTKINTVLPLLGSGVSPLTSVNIYRDGAKIGSVPVGIGNFADTNIVNGESYEYYVTVADGAGNESDPSNLTSITVPLPVVYSPQVVQAVAPAPASDDTVTNETFTDTSFTPASEEGEVKADTTDDEGDKAAAQDQEETKGERNIPLWGIIILLILAGVGGYLFYSQKPEKENIGK